MTVQDTYEWAKKQLGVWENIQEKIPKTELNEFGALKFLKFENQSFTGEVAPTEGDLIFHFFPTADAKFNKQIAVEGERIWVFGDRFADELAQAFLDTFKYQDRLFWDFVPEMNSWAVRVQGYAENPFYLELIEGVLCRLKEKIEK